MELIFEIILEGSLEIWSEKKMPMPIRILAAFILLALYLGFSGFLLFIGYSALMDHNVPAAVIFLAVGFGVLIGVLFLIRTQGKKRPGKEENIDGIKNSDRETGK